MTKIRQVAMDAWKAVPADVGAIADHFRLPWRFYARLFAASGPDPA
jgi:hypothetical protein